MPSIKGRKRSGKGKLSRTALDIREVLDLEADALRRVRDAVDSSYVKAVDLLARCKGKVIVTGIGKSGLIGQKIAATLTATGTPAIYLHPAEGMHGDLGVVQKGDIVLAIGKSGESEELTSIIASLKKFGTPIISLTANPKSTLARNSTLVLYTPVHTEACPLNLSPTCSTTAALAVGDALAVTLMRRKGFGRKHFAHLHPGGSLGKRLTLTVADIMRSGQDNPKIRISDTTSRMLIEMTNKRAGAVSVVDKKGRLIGIITDNDIRRHLGQGENVLKRTIREVMNPKPTTIAPQRMAIEAADIMSRRKNPFLILPVVDKKGRSVGLIHLHDIRARGL